MKRISTLVFILLSFLSGVIAQSDITIGTGTAGNSTTSYPAPLGDYWEGHRQQYLYLASELVAAGMGPGTINSLKWNVQALTTSTNTFPAVEQYTIKIGGSTITTLGITTWETVASTVYGPTDYTPVLGLNTFTFATPFFWNGSDNIIIEVCSGDPANPSGTYYTNNSVVTWTTGLAFNGSRVYAADNGGNLCGVTTGTNGSASTTATTRPNVVFNWTSASACSGTPTAGNAVSTAANLCSGAAFTLSLTGSTVASGLTYQWQSSTDNSTWANIAGATTASYTTSQTLPTAYYRAVVTCGSQSANSQSVKVTTPPLVSGTYTINNTLPAGSGNFQTFADAVNYIKCGINAPVLFKVAAGSGPYNEQVTIPAIGGASSTNTITFKGNLATISFNSTVSSKRAGILLDGADYVTIDSLIISATGSSTTEYGWGVQLTNGADNNKILNCTINVSTSNSTTYNFLGVVLGGVATTPISPSNSGDNNTIAGNTIVGGYYPVIAYGNSAAPYPTGNVISNNIIQDAYSYSIYLYGNANTIVSKNNISRPVRATSATTAGVFLSTGVTGALIEKNRIHNMFDVLASSTSTFYGVYDIAVATAAAPNKIVNNLVYEINHAGAIYGIYNTGGAFMQAYHNTISIDNPAATAGATYGLYQITSVPGIEYKNNIVTIARGGPGAKYAIYFSTAGSVNTSNNNVFYLNSAGSGPQSIGYYGGTAYATLSNWQTANGGIYDQQSVSTDPLYVSSGSGDFTPSAPSVNNIGANVGVTTDILDAVRQVASPDPGAFEFSLGNCVNPPTPGNAVSSVSNVCPNAPFTLNLLGNSVGDGQTYQWQSSSNNTSWTNTGTATTATTFTTTQLSSTYYRAAVKCASGTVVYSTSVYVTSPPLVSGTFTINPTIPTGSGNFQTFTDAINFIKCGISGPVVFNVSNNVYPESITIPVLGGTSAINTVTFNGNGATVSYNTSDANNRAAIILNGADHIIIDSLNVDVSQGTYGWGIVLTNQADSNIIRRCTITNNTSATSANYAGIVVNGNATGTAITGNNGNDNLIERNTVVGGYYGIYLYGSTITYNKRNVISKNTVQDFYLYGIYAYANDSIIISKNDISRPARSAVSTGYGVYAATLTNALVEKNRIHNLFDAAATSTAASYPLYIAGSGASTTAPNRAENNLIYNINNGGGTIYGVYGIGYNNWNYYHNTVILDDASATAGTTYGMYVYGTAVNVKDNIVLINRGGTGTKYCLYYSTTGVTSSNNNVLVMTSTSGTNGVGYYNAGYTTLAAWQAANGAVYDQQSIDADPVFDPNYMPTNSLVNNIGAPVGVATDIVDVARSTSNPDPGAYEFSTLTTGLNFAAEALITPTVNSKGCYTSSEPVTIRIRNNRTTTHNFATNPVTVTVNVTGASNQTLSFTLNSGTLQSDSTLNVLMSQPLNMSAAGTYTINAKTTLAGDVNASNDAMQPKNLTKETLTAGAAAASPDSYCAPSPVNPALSTTGATGYSGLQWKESLTSNGAYVNIAGATTSPYTITSPLTQNKYYKLFAACGTSTDSSAAVVVTYTNPQVTGTTPGSRCGTGTVTLSATGNAGSTLNWYTAATGGTAVATGNTYTTPSISANTTYYVSASNGASYIPLGGAGVAWNTVTTVGSFQTTSGLNSASQVFDVYQPLTIATMDIYPSAAIGSTFTIEVRSGTATGTVVGTYTGTTTVQNSGTPSVAQTVPVNFNIPAAGTYFVGFASGNPNTWRSSFATPYPYPVTYNGYLSVTGSNLGGLYWYYLYNWVFSAGCETTRTAVLAKTDNCPTPVALLNFRGERQGSINRLEWSTATETNNSGFELQRSADGRNFSSITFVSSKATNGNSSNVLTYAFNDMKPLAGNGYYRLKQIDKDGKATWSNIVLIKGAKVNAVTVTSIYPNPVKEQLNMIVESPSTALVNLVVTDVTGKVVMEQAAQLTTGDNQLKVNVLNLSSGTYIIKAVCKNGCESAVQKFVKQ